MSRAKGKLPHDEAVRLRVGLMDLLVAMNKTRCECCVADEHDAELAVYRDMKLVREVMKMVDEYEEKMIDQVYNAFPRDKIEVIIG